MKLFQRAILALVLMLAPFAATADLAFLPYEVDTATVEAGTTSAPTALILPVVSGRRVQVRVYNAGTVPVFIVFGREDAVATTGATPVAPGSTAIFTVPEGATHVAAITASGTATVYFTAGEGS